MSVQSLANDFFAAVRDDRREDYQAMWADDIVSREPGDGPMAKLQGREALLEKHAWWESNTEVHDERMEGPYVNGDEFAVHYHMDVTMDGKRHKMSEVGIYTVRDDKVVEERFFYPQQD